MFLFEIAHPAGAFDDADRELFGSSVTDTLTAPGHAPEETMRRAALATHLAFHELTGWRTGNGPYRRGDPPPLIVTVTTPQAWIADEGARFYIGTVRAAVNRLDAAHGWKRDPGSLWVRINGVPDGSIGCDGKQATADDVLDFLTADYRAAVVNGDARKIPAGKLLDPTCGMLVPDVAASMPIEHDGVRVGFCAKGCSDSYIRHAGLHGMIAEN